ncbi:hypothetical protein G7B40_040345 [Aetokthonos hydrillicola Thurmond2011]|jgi:hypothetical protein|uniref:Uncharacterized protein n=1 Tax=Aetokthonos hydrillicola Thurmond2011 TaxID=2712845 RepID=A0AAP5MEC7_9CYAN|nr:hypothetical protein [Aetokthonos hydrillicola]MBO3459979.1 hypothetical protein [Aetokthonos hydrillicola CCALA 1050]MBW4584098.1 hypothetical protein [Aetokthonos hydrillicola CCALA 1050]MDR9900739.1 hypothetical protein [Aetokthonos hydrillicola Thurmond2011]
MSCCKPFVPNIKITFTLPVEGQFTTDPETGNPLQLTVPYEVEAWLEGNNAVKSEPGSNPNTVMLRGYSVNPRILPNELTCKQSEAQAVYTDPLTLNQHIGKFTLKPRFDSTRPVVARALARRIGTEIEGTFEWR